MTESNNKNNKKTIQIVKINNYVSIWLTYINFIKQYLTNFSNKKKAQNNLSNASAILVMEAMREIDESTAGARLGCLPVNWSRFLRSVYYHHHLSIHQRSDVYQ